MPRQARKAPGGLICHVLNRGVGRMNLFRHQKDYIAFLRCFRDVLDESPMAVLAYCIMPNHWHLVLAPRRDGQLSQFMQRLTITHARRWIEHRRRVGSGHVYQGRFKSFACQSDGHFLALCRYVERNPLRTKLVARAEDWPFSSLRAGLGLDKQPMIPLTKWPVPRPADWRRRVNRAQPAAEEAALRKSIATANPLGDDKWTAKQRKRLGIADPKPIGRPRKAKNL